MPYDVVIAGAGPIGLFLACELRLQGLTALVLERRTEIDPTIKAGAIAGRGADILARRGIVDLLGDLPSLADLMRGRRPGARGLQATAPQDRPPLGHFAGLWILRGGSQPAEVPIIAGQQVLERALEGHATSPDGPGAPVVIRRGHSVAGVDQDATGVAISVVGPEGPYEVRAAHLVGCDGGRSTVRKAAGFAFPGLDGVITGHQAIVEVDDPNFFPFGWHRTDHGLLVRGPMPERVLTVEFDGPPADRDAPVTREEIQASLRRLSGTEVTVTAVRTATRFTDNTRQAETYAMGRVLLAGDAAHVHPPFGGQGLTLGLGDAMNLGWKLAAHVRGTAPEELLATYTSERHPVAARVLHNTRAQVALLAPGPRVGALRDVFTDLAGTEEANRRLTDLMGDLDLRYDTGAGHPLAGRYCPELALTTEDGPTSVAARSRCGRPLLLDLAGRAEIRGAVRPWADRVDLVTGDTDDAPAAAVLVRPDGYVAWAGDDVGGLRQACAKVVRYAALTPFTAPPRSDRSAWWSRTAGTEVAKVCSSVGATRYTSNMCSTHGERLASLTRAIDDLAAEGLAGLPPDAWAERVAGIWALVEGIDPELARRRACYSTIES